MLGLESHLVRLEPHDPRWSHRFEDESRALMQDLGELAVQIEHIGSTAVPQIEAKPIIDIAIQAASLRHLAQIESVMKKAGYISKGEFGLPGRHFFTKGDPTSFHAHIVESGSTHWDLWIAFRDALRSDAALLRDYGALKKRLAKLHATDRSAYTAAKTEFITGVCNDPARHVVTKESRSAQ